MFNYHYYIKREKGETPKTTVRLGETRKARIRRIARLENFEFYQTAMKSLLDEALDLREKRLGLTGKKLTDEDFGGGE